MIALVEGAKRQKTPNEIALTILLSALTFIFLLVVRHAEAVRRLLAASTFSVPVLIALLVCLIPTTIGGLLSAIGIAGIDRLHPAQRHRDERPRRGGRGRHRRAAARQDRHHHPRQPPWPPTSSPAPGVTEQRSRRCRAARLAGRRNARRPQHRRAGQGEVQHSAAARSPRRTRTFVPFTAQTRMSGVDFADAEPPQHPQGCRRLRARHGSKHRAARFRPKSRQAVGRHLPRRRHAARRRRRRQGARRGPAQGHRQGRHQGALRPASQDGHPHRHDHRRQSADRRRHRRRGRRGRLHGPGHARGRSSSASATSRPPATSSP